MTSGCVRDAFGMRSADESFCLYCKVTTFADGNHTLAYDAAFFFEKSCCVVMLRWWLVAFCFLIYNYLIIN